jgi:hypothetical protein
MNKPSLTSRFGGALGNEFAEIRAALRALWPVQSPDELVQITTQGTSRRPARSTSSQSLVTHLCAVTYEGPDALRCRDTQTGDILIVAKPFELQKVNNIYVHEPYHQFTTGSLTDVPTFWESANIYKAGIVWSPFVQEFRRQIHLSGVPRFRLDLASNSYVPMDVFIEQVIEPPYRFMQAEQNVDPTDIPQLLALKVPGVLKVNDATLEYDANGTTVDYLDLNVSARRWQKLQETIAFEYVDYDITEFGFRPNVVRT